MDVAIPACCDLDTGVRDEAERDAVGDRKGERHRDRGDDGRCRFGEVVPFDLGEAARHQTGDVEKGRRRRVGGDGSGKRRKKERQKEQDADGRCGETGPAAGIDARRALEIAGRRRGADRGTDHGGGAVGNERPAQPRDGAVGPHEATAMGQRDQRAGVVEQVDEQEREDHRHEPHLQGTR